MTAPRDSGGITLNGAAARLFHVGDKVIIAAASLLTDEPVWSIMLLAASDNRFAEWLVDNNPVVAVQEGDITSP